MLVYVLIACESRNTVICTLYTVWRFVTRLGIGELIAHMKSSILLYITMSRVLDDINPHVIIQNKLESVSTAVQFLMKYWNKLHEDQ